MSMIQKSPPGLLSLPNEILASICTHAVDKEPSTRGKDWLLAVRHTCKLLYTPATRELAKRFLKSLTVMMSRYSLQELVALCKHDLIGPHVQEIVFCPSGLDACFFQAGMDSLAIEDDLEGFAEAERLAEWYSARLEDEKRLEESGDAKMLFKQAFGLLKRYRQSIKLTATTRELLNVLFNQSNARNDKLRIEEFPSFSKVAHAFGSLTMSVFTIFEAAFAAGSPIHHFEARMNDMQGLDFIDLSDECIQALSRLQRLDSDIIGPFPDSTMDNKLINIVSEAKGLVRVVFSSSKTESVKKSWGSLSYMMTMTRVLDSHALRQIWLRELTIHYNGLLKMLRRHKSTLRELTMYNVLLVGSWDDILLSIRDDLQLDKLVMINLVSVDWDEIWYDFQNAEVDSALNGGVEFYGHANVTSGIDQVLCKWNRASVDPDYDPSWRSATDMSHLTYPED